MCLSRIGRVTIVLGLSLALSACVVGPPGYYGRGYYGGAILFAPPAPRFEDYGAPPYPGDVWIAGYWQWAAGGYRWVRGYWSPPHPGYRWVPHQWVHGSRGWQMTGGQWAREGRGERRGRDHRGDHRGDH